MLKNALIVLAAIVAILVLVEVVALLRLRASVKSYAQYWQNRPKSGQFVYVALGDSAAQGIGASQPQLGYVGLLASQITASTGQSVELVNLGVTGAKVEDVITKQLPQLARYKPNLITVEVGANDVNSFDKAKFQSQFDQLCAELPKTAIVANVPYFGGRIRKNDLAVQASQIIESCAAKNGLTVADLQGVTRARQSVLNYAADLFHPSDRGYRIWTSAFWQVIGPRLTKP